MNVIRGGGKGVPLTSVDVQFTPICLGTDVSNNVSSYKRACVLILTLHGVRNEESRYSVSLVLPGTLYFIKCNYTSAW